MTACVHTVCVQLAPAWITYKCMFLLERKRHLHFKKHHPFTHPQVLQSPSCVQSLMVPGWSVPAGAQETSPKQT